MIKSLDSCIFKVSLIQLLLVLRKYVTIIDLTKFGWAALPSRGFTVHYTTVEAQLEDTVLILSYSVGRVVEQL